MDAIWKVNPFGIYLFKFNHENSGKMCEICSRRTIKTLELRAKVVQSEQEKH